MSPRAWVGGTDQPVSSAPVDKPVTYKMVQIASPPAAVPTLAQLQDAQVGAVRTIAHWPRTAAQMEGLISPLVGPDSANPLIFPMVCIAQNTAVSALTGMTRLEWEARVTDLVTNVPSTGIFELMNEVGATFKYDGTAGTNWSRYFLACEHAAAIIRNPPFNRRCVLGAARDSDTNAMLTAAQQHWGPKASGWPFDGVAIHPYGQGAAAWTRNSALGTVKTRLNNARVATRLGNNGVTGDLLDNMPLWITEMNCGGVGGNTNSTLVVSTDSVQTTARGPSSQPITGANFTLLTTSMPAGFDSPSGSVFLRSTGAPLADSRKITYAGTTGTPSTPGSFTGCNTASVTAGETVADATTIARWVPDGNATRETMQSNLVTDLYQGNAGASFTSLWTRRVKADLHLKSIGFFIWRDYVGYTGAAPLVPLNWAELSGLNDWNGGAVDSAVPPARRRPAYTPFKAEVASMSLP